MNADFHRELVRGLIGDQLHDVNRYFEAEERWSTQGFGMARLYLTEDRDVRLNVWHSALGMDCLNMAVLALRRVVRNVSAAIPERGAPT